MAQAPNRKKSYHSKVVPTVVATIKLKRFKCYSSSSCCHFLLSRRTDQVDAKI
jgi:hypothetical protein